MTRLVSRQATEDRKLEIIQAVLALSAGRSPGQITTADIAATLGLSGGAIFKHFPNKDAIWLAVTAWVDHALSKALLQAAGDHAHPLDALRAMFDAHVEFVICHPGVPRFIFHELQQPDATATKRQVALLLQRYRHLLVTLLDNARSEGNASTSLDCDAAATLFIGMIQGLVMQSMLAGKVEQLREAGARTFPVYLAGITAQATS